MLSLSKSSLLKSSVAASAMTALLIVGGCNRADKGQGALKSSEMAALNLDRADAKIFAKHFALDTCAADEMEALGALAGMGLGETGDGGVSFAARDVQSGTVTYRELSVRGEEADFDGFTADVATFHCAKMTDAGPVFDRLDLTDARVRNEDVTFTFETLNISEPTPDAARAILDGIISPNAGPQQGEIGFRAVSLTGATVAGLDFNGTLDALAWGETRDNDLQGVADMMVEDLDLTFNTDDESGGLSLAFDGMSARNFSVGGLDISNAATSSGMMGSLLDGFTLLKKPYDEFVVEALTLSSNEFEMDFKGIEGLATEEGDVVTIRQTLKPMTVNLKPAMGENRVFADMYARLKTLDFETMKLSGSSVTTLDKGDDSLTVTDGLMVMEDAFRLNFEYAAEGLDAMVQAAKDQDDAGRGTSTLDIYDALKLRSFRMTVEDNSITERGLRLASEMTGQSEKNLKRALGMAVLGAALAAENDVQADVYSQTASAFADFVKDGGTLTIEANPPAPFPLAPLISGGGEDVDPDTLGFSATQESPE